MFLQYGLPWKIASDADTNIIWEKYQIFLQ